MRGSLESWAARRVWKSLCTFAGFMVNCHTWPQGLVCVVIIIVYFRLERNRL